MSGFLSMNIYRILFLITILLISSIFSGKCYSQNFGTLRGHVVDSLSGEALPYANILIRELNIGSSTDTKGYFIIPSVNANKNLTLFISYLGYTPKEIQIKIVPNKVTHLDIVLSSSELELQTIEKVGQRVADRNNPNIAVKRITIRELQALPKGVETDVFRSLQYVSGVQSTGDISSRYYVRGSSADQNLILFNGVSIYNPFHALGMFSIFDPEIINSVQFYKGGFTAEYGGRVSSVLDMTTKNGNKNRFSAKATASFLTGKVLLQGPIGNGSYIISGRKTHSTNILSKFLDGQSLPLDFYDLSFKVNYANNELSPGSRFIVHGFISDDKIQHQQEFSEDYQWGNQALGVTWFQVVQQSPIFFDLGIAISNFQGEILQKLSDVAEKENEVNDFSFNGNISYVFDSKDEVKFGFNIKDIKTNLLLKNRRNAITDIGRSGAHLSTYLKYKLLRFDSFGLDIGTRINLISLSRRSQNSFEPRISFTYSLIPQISLKGAYGIYFQDLVTLSDESAILSIFDPWVISPSHLNPTKSVHYILGLSTIIVPELKFNAEVYLKDTKNLLIINEDKIFHDDPDFIPGKGEAYGWEVNLDFKSKVISANAAFTSSWSYNNVNAWTYYPKYASKYSVNIGTTLSVGKGWEASIMWVYNSGIPFTQLAGYYSKYIITDPYFDQNYSDSRIPFTLLGDKNLGRLPDYHRMDIVVSKKMNFYSIKSELAFSIINVYDRKNILYFKRDTGEKVYMLPFLPTATFSVEI